MKLEEVTGFICSMVDKYCPSALEVHASSGEPFGQPGSYRFYSRGYDNTRTNPADRPEKVGVISADIGIFAATTTSFAEPVKPRNLSMLSYCEVVNLSVLCGEAPTNCHYFIIPERTFSSTSFNRHGEKWGEEMAQASRMGSIMLADMSASQSIISAWRGREEIPFDYEILPFSIQSHRVPRLI